MADLRKCIDAAKLDRALSQEAAEEYRRRLDEILGEDANVDGPDWHEKQQRAAVRLQKEIERTLHRKRRMRIKQAATTDALRSRLAAAPAKQRDKAAVAVLDFDPTGRHTGSNVAMRHMQARGTAWGLMSDFIDRFRSKHGGLTRNTSGMRDVVKGLFGEATTPEARALAEGIQEARGFLTNRANVAGADIRQRKAWGWVQKHDAETIKRAGVDQWVEFIIPRLDRSKMYNPAGLPMSDREFVMAVRGSFDTLTSDDLAGMAEIPPEAAKWGSPVNRRIHHRELVFRDADAWLQYQEKFGDPDLFGSIVGEIDRLARDVAQMEILGPYPKAALEMMQSQLPKRSKFLDNTFAQVTGQANSPDSRWFASFSSTNRSLITAARLGSAIFVSLADFATNTLTARMNGVPTTRLTAELLRQLNPANGAHRRMAARMGYIAETWAGSQVGAMRLIGEVTGLPPVARITDSVLRLSGLNAWTDGGRSAFKMELVGHMTEEATKPFDQVEPLLRGSMQRHGVTAEMWDMYRQTSIWTDPETGATFIRPEDVWLEIQSMPEGLLKVGERRARFEAAQRIGEMIQTEGHFAVVSPTARSRAIATGGTTPGTFWGEMVRNVTLFKSFAVSFNYLHVSRMLAQRGLRGKAEYMAWIAIGSTVAGAIAEQASQVARGKDPRDMTEARFWVGAVARGGGLGPVGDILYAGVGGKNRFGDSIASSILGPVMGELEAFANLTGGNITELINDGEAKNVGADLVRFAEGLTPGNSLWYSRTAFDRIMKDELVAWIDGEDAERRFRRIERSAKRDFDQRFWWRPGTPVPSRAPDASEAFGN
ncbi:hypothetical protein HBA54_03145 [Pelagibius litoralis]|uniref:Uncharacterized protein n=1 Tax=Pelagibius litoralis TaxID=374515 RepID=A0A967EWN8_9PROT|nr:hypothetical protein [Pelagibius litoralis]NIA67578.1 hypothetical protein [Pelagibius litoralis]